MTKYQKVYDDIINRITNGVWLPGSLIPGEMELCDLYGVSRITIRKALDELTSAGYVSRIQGKGTFASSPMKYQSGSSTLGFGEYMNHCGVEVLSRLCTAKLIEADDICRNKLLLHDEENKVWHFKRVRIVKGNPIAVMDTYVRQETGEMMNEYDLSKESFFALYRKIFGKSVTKSISSLSAVIPDTETRKLLKMPRVSAGILYESTAYLEDGGVPIQYDISIFNPAYYKFTASEGIMTPTSL